MDPRWTDALASYLSEIAISPMTYRNYKATLELFFSDRRDPATVTALDIHSFVHLPSRRSGKPASPQTVNARLNPLRAFYSRAVSFGLLDRDPTIGVKRPKANRPMPRWLHAAQVRQFMDAVFVATKGTRKGMERGFRNKAAFSVGFLTGLRLREIVSLTAGDLQKGYPAPNGGLFIRVKVKGRKTIDSLFPPQVLAAVREYLVIRDLVLETMDPRESIWSKLSAHALENAVTETGRAAGLGHLTSHVMRHSFARARRRAGSEIEVIQRSLGHSSASTTEHYLKTLDPVTDEKWIDVARAMGF